MSRLNSATTKKDRPFGNGDGRGDDHSITAHPVDHRGKQPKQEQILECSRSLEGSDSRTVSEDFESQHDDDYSDDGGDMDDVVTYWSLIRDNAPYRWYLASYVTNYYGEWLTYLSSLSAIQVMLSSEKRSSTTVDDESIGWREHPQTLISYLVVIRLMTSVIFSPLGGVLADGAWDRRHIMIFLDLCGAVVAWLFVLAVHIGIQRKVLPIPSQDEQEHTDDSNLLPQESETEGMSRAMVGILWIFIATFFQQAFSGGLYEPSRAAILPSLVKTHIDDDSSVPATKQRRARMLEQKSLKKATIISGVAWSTMAALGSATGGFIVAQLGIRACFILDCMTYLISALCMYYCAKSDGNRRGEYQRIAAASRTHDNSITSVHNEREDDIIANGSLGGHGEDSSSEQPNKISNNANNYLFSWSCQYNIYYEIKTMVWDGLQYTCRSFWGPLVLLKFSSLWLTLDVANVKFASSTTAASYAINGKNDSDPNEQVRDNFEDEVKEQERDAFRLGLLFTGVGVGCLLGPLIAEKFTSMQRPATLQFACITSVGIAALACLCMGGMAVFLDDSDGDNTDPTNIDGEEQFNPSHHLPWAVFGSLCVLTSIRAMGISVVWINSSLLLQTFSTPQMLGRVSSFDFALALLGESASAILSGRLEDDHDWTPFQVCRGLGFLGLCFWGLWMWFHLLGKGAASIAFKRKSSSVTSRDEMDKSWTNQEVEELSKDPLLSDSSTMELVSVAAKSSNDDSIVRNGT